MKKFNKAIALVLALALLLPTLMFSLSSCKKDPDDSNDKGNNNGDKTETASYGVTVVTKGGMPLTQLPIYIYGYEDGSIGEMVENGYAATDESGKAAFKLPKGGDYAAKIDMSIPEGYDVESFYPLTSTDMTLVVSSSVIPETSLVGVSYNMGSVLRDFTINTTTLVKNEEGNLEFKDEVFTLSEVLKEKKAVFINFWYTTCSWCVTEFPFIQTAYENYADDIAVLALDPYADDSVEAIENFQAEMGLTFNVAKDIIGLKAAFPETGYPTSVMIDRYGVVTLFHEGAIPSERTFNLIFEYFTNDNYEQKLIYDVSDLVPKEKPNVEMPSAEELGNAFEKEDLGDINYHNDDDDEYSWPFITGTIGEGDDATAVVYPSNSKVEASYAQLIFDVHLEVGDVIAFDYFSSTELGADILYVIVDGKDIYSISGESEDWATCFAYVAEEEGDYEIGLVYNKDTSDDVGDDTVYLKDLRVLTVEDINSPSYIFRFAATNPDEWSEYQDYVTPVLGADGYYHVDSADGPILLVNLMGYTRFSDENALYYMAVELYEDDVITKEQYSKIIEYCTYSSNATINGVCPVTPELKEHIDLIVKHFGNPDNENEWQKFCCYYDAYGTDGKQLEDPIKGLSLFSAYEVIESPYGSTEYPNSFTYDRLIMPRGLLGKFTPTVSGTYLISSNSYDEATDTYGECDAWIFTEGTLGERVAWLTYSNVDRNNTTDHNNCYMIAYLEAGKDYYIDIAYYDVYGTGTIKYRVERLGGEGVYRFSIASPGFFTSLESVDGEMTKTIAGGIEVEKGDDNIWREKRTDGRQGSILYADFTKYTPIFSNRTLAEMIDMGAFNFTYNEDGETQSGMDYTAKAREIYAKRIVAGYNSQLGEYIAADDERIGCVVVTDEVAQLLQMIMDKYTFAGIENSWTKLCYYHQYFCAATPK